ncbi:DNA polymerase III subunit alpha [Granulicatella sp. zg-ZJ]|uniref:DNA polymerase III subunit alpha n=1 Tax=Granulicatella sp. zg-ZJ TaxID=2678504 RepID=UPI0013D0FA0A|nr:DNA polymerase III subunit alpha [Granulicatella sp. zg-ZJ]NEW62582.1 DNA polymerase III subunit alpha [Granulicatella sp. zg-ZJ]
MFTPAQMMTAFSLLKSPTSISQYVTDAKEKGYTTLVLSEWQTLSSAVSFFNECQKQHVKPIIGLTFPIDQMILVAISMNEKGYLELVDLSSQLLLEQFSVKQLSNYQHITFLTTQNITREQLTYLCEYIDKKFLRISVYADDTKHISLAREYQIDTIANRVVKYLNPTDYLTLKVLQSIEDNTTIEETMTGQTGADYLPYAQQFKENFREYSDILYQTEQFYESIDTHIPLHQSLLPKFSTHAYDELRQIAYAGLEKRGLQLPVYQERLEKELSIINQMGFSDYFLIVWDLMTYAHQEGIMTGAGRGSSAASLVSYCLNITQVDPIQNQLLFERFLNPERYTMPDIDLDFPDNRRQDMLQYVAKKYGADKVAQIATFGTFAAKQALRDVSRVLGCTQVELKKWSSSVPNSLKITLKQAYEQSVSLQKLVEKSEKNKLIFDLACKIEGLPRHVSTHAAGVVISDRPLTTIIPIQQSEPLHLTQFAMQDVEQVGLLKMDFLGLKNLSILADAQNAIQKINPQFNVWHIDFQDEKTLDIFRKADTEGIFQFESPGIKRVLQFVSPNSLEEVAAVNALYRPGPMQQIPHFADRKHQKELVVYPHDDLKDILEETYGIIVYQEQVMQIANKMAGFSLGQADLLRRAIGKMKKDVLLAEKEHFITGAIQNGYSKEIATTVYEYIEKFANYGFPKSHAFAYSVLAYQLAYMKAHYPHAFYLALLLHVNAKSERFTSYLMEAKQHGVTFLLPHINKSHIEHTVQGEGTILFGLSAIQGIYKDLRYAIVKERFAHGIYQSFEDFVSRMDKRYCKKDILETLIFSGAFDCFGKTRATLVSSIDAVLDNTSLFLGILPLKEERLEEYDEDTIREKEKEILGYAFSNDALDAFMPYYQTGQLQKTADIVSHQQVILLGYLRKIKKITTKNNKRMAFAVLEDAFGKVNMTIFPTVYVANMSHIEENELIVVHGKIEWTEREELTCIVQRFETVDAFLQKENQCFLKIEDSTMLKDIQALLLKHPGHTQVVVYFSQSDVYKKMPEKYNVYFQDAFKKEVEDLLGSGNVVLRKNKK